MGLRRFDDGPPFEPPTPNEPPTPHPKQKAPKKKPDPREANTQKGTKKFRTSAAKAHRTRQRVLKEGTSSDGGPKSSRQVMTNHDR